MKIKLLTLLITFFSLATANASNLLIKSSQLKLIISKSISDIEQNNQELDPDLLSELIIDRLYEEGRFSNEESGKGAECKDCIINDVHK